MFVRVAPEQHDTLPEIPEPQEHAHLFGHDEQAAMLARAHAAGHLHHACLLVGPAGIGKATLAFRLAAHLLSGAVGEALAMPDPAGTTARLIAQGAHPSLLHLTRPLAERDKRFRTVITVEEVRRIGRFVGMTAHDGGYRAVIVDPVDDLNVSAANALLKNLEEPPQRTVFLLVAHSPGRVLPTIRSRCLTLRLSPLDRTVLLAALDAVGAGVPKGEAERAALYERSGGSVRRAIMLTAFGGLEIAEAVDRALAAGRFDAAEAHRIGDALTRRGETVPFDLFNRHILERIGHDASAAAMSGDLARANALAELQENVSRAVTENAVYNLDRRQHVVGTLRLLNERLGI